MKLYIGEIKKTKTNHKCGIMNEPGMEEFTCLGSVTVPSTSNKHKIFFLAWDIFGQYEHKKQIQTLDMDNLVQLATFTFLSAFKNLRIFTKQDCLWDGNSFMVSTL